MDNTLEKLIERTNAARDELDAVRDALGGAEVRGTLANELAERLTSASRQAAIVTDWLDNARRLAGNAR